MAPTIVLRDGRPWLAVGSPGGATIITTVLQTLVNRIDFTLTLPEAIAAPRASERNGASTQAEPAFPVPGLQGLGHTFAAVPEIGAATGIESLGRGRGAGRRRTGPPRRGECPGGQALTASLPSRSPRR